MQRDLPAKYYLDHFREFVGFLKARCSHLLDRKHLDYLDIFNSLDEDAQCLMVRILNRKGHVIKLDTLRYEEITDIPKALRTLEHSNLIGSVSEPFIQPALLSLTKPELIELAALEQNSLNTSLFPKKSQNKAHWLNWVSQYVSHEIITQHPLMSSLIVNYQGDIFDYLLFLYFGNLKGKLNQFSLRDMGIMGTRKNQVHENVRFSTLNHAQSAFFYANKNQDIQYWSEDTLVHQAQLMDTFPLVEGQLAIKQFNHFSYRLGKALLPIDHSLAMQVLEQSHDPQAIEKRIREWYKLGQMEKVKHGLDSIIDQPPSEHLFIFATDFLERKFNKKRTSILTDVLRNGPPPIPMDEAFINDVELGVINHHTRNGKMAIRTENQPWRALFALTFWNELFEHPKTGLCSEFDYLPTVLKDDCFYETIPEDIHSRLESLNERVSFKRWITQQWTSHYGKANGIFYWHPKLLEVVLLILEYSPLDGLIRHLMDMSKRYQELNDGYPDILILENQQLRLEEIKAPGDQLRRNQLIIIQKLKGLGWDVSIQTVEWQLNPNQPYVVVDIETTGGGQGHHRITEIGMVKIENGQTTDTWQSLINPQRHIPKYITELTGISNQMVCDAPLFSEVADDVRRFCEGCIFVAHNVNFDYGFFKQEYERLEQRFRLPKLCTVRLAKRFLPGYESYSLGKLCKDLGIPLENHHRALDDAKAAAEILKRVNENRSNQEPIESGK